MNNGTDIPTFTRTAAALVAANDAPSSPRQADVDGLRELLDLVESFSSNDQKARYILTSNWFRDHGESAGAWAAVTGVWLDTSARTVPAQGRVRA